MQSPYTLTESLAHQTRRHFLSRCGMGLGSMALASMAQSEDSNPLVGAGSNNALSSKLSHHVAKAKQVIYLFMAGGPSQLELLDYKPVLQQYNGKAIPDSYLEGKRFAFMDSSFKNRIRFWEHAEPFNSMANVVCGSATCFHTPQALLTNALS